ncbi:MAG: DNA primase [Bacilli bacterium]|nr:DNA primase [Bacilli bacterium]
MNSNVNKNGPSLRQQIIEKVDIVNVIGEYVPLTKKGANYVGLCPFHDDQNPSMFVSPTKKVFKCFSCNAGGDVVKFVSRFKNITDMQAMRELGESVGITFKLTKKEIERKKNEKYYNVLKEAADFYSFYLENVVEAEEAKNYIHGRGLDDETIKRFKIGASGENDELYNVLLQKGYLPIEMIDVNLVNSYKDKYHDVFKNRIIFPLENLDGEIIGFSGRRYKINDNDAKYLNTKDTVVFKKGDILYNYHDAYRKIKDNDCVYLFEGYMDVIAAVRCGVENSVASMGTALTQNQINAIKRLTNNIIIGYDSDGPGVMATIKAIDNLIYNKMNIKVIRIPDGKDADEFILKNGREQLFNCLNNNVINAIDFIYDFYLKYLIKDDISSIDKFKVNIYKAIAKFDSLTITENYLKKLSNEINISIESLKIDYEKFFNSYKYEIEKAKAEFENKNNYYNNYDNSYNNFNNNNFNYYSNENKFNNNNQYANNVANEFDYNDIPPIIEDYGGVLQYQDDYPNNQQNQYGYSSYQQKKQLNNNTKKLSEKSEEFLILVSYNSKKKCLEIKSRIEESYVDQINHDILEEICNLYHDYERIDEKMIFSKLDNEEEKRLRKILDSSIGNINDIINDEKQIKKCIENVKKYAYIAVKEDYFNNPDKDLETLKKIEQLAKQTTTIRFKK